MLDITGYQNFSKILYSLSAEISDAVVDHQETGELEAGVTPRQQAAFLNDLLKLSDNLFLTSGHCDVMAERVAKASLKK